MSCRIFAQIGRAVVAANCDEIGLTTKVVFRRKPGNRAMDGHTEQ